MMSGSNKKEVIVRQMYNEICFPYIYGKKKEL